MKRWSIVALVGLILSSAPSMAPPAHSSCASGIRSARLTTEVYKSGDETETYNAHLSALRGDEIEEAESESADLIFELALWPFDNTVSYVSVNVGESGSLTLYFNQDGTVDTQVWNPVEGPTKDVGSHLYTPGAWNDIRLRFDPTGDEVKVFVNDASHEMDIPLADIRIEYLTIQTLVDPHDGATRTAYVDSLKAISVDGGKRSMLYSEAFEKSTGGITTGPGRLEPVDSTYLLADGTSCKIPTYISVKKTLSWQKIKVQGDVKPDAVGRNLKVTLFKKKNGRFVKSGDTKTVVVDEADEYRATFKRPDADRCRITVKLPETKLRPTAVESRKVFC